MNIAIDARRVEDFGIGTYIRNLVRTLAKTDYENNYLLLGDPAKVSSAIQLTENFRVLPWGSSKRKWKSELWLHQLLQSNAVDLLHIPYVRPAILIPCRYLMTVHDLAEFLYPRNPGWEHNLRWRMVRRTLLRARRIMAVSRATRSDIENLFGIPSERVTVIENAIDERFVQSGRKEEQRLVLERYRVQDPFLLYVGSARPQKNLPRLIEAFAVIKGELLNHPVYNNLKLLIIGDELSEHPDLRRSVVRTRMQNDVRFLGFVPVEILRMFYQAAEVFVFPSLHEGFGLPPLEAMAQGTPVVTSNVSSLPEVVGDAAVLVHPENIFEIARGVQAALLDHTPPGATGARASADRAIQLGPVGSPGLGYSFRGRCMTLPLDGGGVPVSPSESPTNFSFEVLHCDKSTKARCGLLRTNHGIVRTPVFMPVGTAGTVKGLTQEHLEETTAEIILANTYHLFLRPSEITVREMGGLHKFMSWPRSILTDSGGFQVLSMSSLRKLSEDGVEFRSHLDGARHHLTPERAVEIQFALGSDIQMVLDECTEFPAGEVLARDSMERTLRWAVRARETWHRLLPSVPPERRGALFGIVQGGTLSDLRKRCADELVAMDFPGYAIGGLSVGEARPLTYELVAAAEQRLPEAKPRYVMGVGLPEELPHYVALGVDMMDCVLPTRNGRNGLIFTSQGRLHIRQARFARDSAPLDPDCLCMVCRRYSRAYLRHLFIADEMLGKTLNSFHNVFFYLDTMRRIRETIVAGEFDRFLCEFSNRVRGEVP